MSFVEIGKNEDRNSTGVTVRQERNPSGKEGSDMMGVGVPVPKMGSGIIG